MSRELEVVVAAVREAGPLLVAESQRPDGPRGGGMKAPVDEEIGALLSARINAVFPDDHIICEEGGGHVGTSKRAFHIDPHDGTRDFLNGRRETSISVGLVDDGRLIMGVVFAPMAVPLLDGGTMLVTWAEGELLCLNEEPIPPPAPPAHQIEAEHTILVSTRVSGERLDANRHHLAPAQVEHCASIATRLALVAIGRVEAGLTINHYLKSWDFAGAQALLQAAGGDIYDPLGHPIVWDGIHPIAPSLPGFFGARDRGYAGLVTKAVRPLIHASPDSEDVTS